MTSEIRDFAGIEIVKPLKDYEIRDENIVMSYRISTWVRTKAIRLPHPLPPTQIHLTLL